jgi:hypothetical protein
LFASAAGGQKEPRILPKLYQNFTEFNQISFFTADDPGEQQRGRNNGALDQGALPGR